MTHTEEIAKDIEQNTQTAPENKVVYSATELLRRGCREMPMLFAPVFQRVGLTILAGQSDGCKSMLLRNMAICCVTGRDFLGWQYRGIHKSCIYVSTEDDEDATSYLLGRHNATYADNAEDWSGLRFFFGNENIFDALDKLLAESPADLVIIDAYSDVFDGKEQNSAAQVRTFINPYKALAKKHQCHVVFLHHTGKRTEELAPSKNNFVGSQSLEAAVRLGIELRLDKNDPELRHLCIVKGNYLGNEFKRASFVLRMDGNFVFRNTGERVPFEELGTIATSTAGRKPKDVELVDVNEYKTLFAEIFKDGNLTKRNLLHKIREYREVGTVVAERIVEHAS